MIIKKISTEEITPLVAEHLSSNHIFGRYYVAEDEDGEILGFVGIARRSWFFTEIRHLFVMPQHRGKSIGTQLVEYVLTKVKTPLVCSTVVENNQPGRRIFANFGFQEKTKFTNSQTGNRVVFYVTTRHS